MSAIRFLQPVLGGPLRLVGVLEEELAQDVLEIITVFSARLYGSRSRKNKKLVDAAKVLIGE